MVKLLRTWCYRPHYLNIQRLSYLRMNRQDFLSIALYSVGRVSRRSWGWRLPGPRSARRVSG